MYIHKVYDIMYPLYCIHKIKRQRTQINSIRNEICFSKVGIA